MQPLTPDIPLPAGWSHHVKAGVLHAIALAHYSLTVVRGWCVNSRIARVRLASENERLRTEVQLLREEIRIKDCRLSRIPPRQRPHYPPVERMAILTLQAARGWSCAQLAVRFLITTATILTWRSRLEQNGPDALVQIPKPVNRFPDFVNALVQRLKTLCPAMGKKRIADVLARAGLHLGLTTIARMLRRPKPPVIPPERPQVTRHPSARTLTARYPHHAWNLDLTAVPTAAGFWVPWLPFAVFQRWPFCWWVLPIIDHFSRYAIGYAVFRSPPTTAQVCAALSKAIRRVGRSPKYIITDQGSQFGADYRQWCARRGIKPRFGAVGRYGSISVIERFNLTLKSEGLRSVLIPLGLTSMCDRLRAFFGWYNLERPHSHLGGATPAEVLEKRRPKNRNPRLEPRARYPAESACAAPRVTARATGCRLGLVVSGFPGAEQLPIVRLKKAA